MATTQEYKEYILEQLELLEEIEAKQMMGEFLLYYQDKLFGGIYDNQLLIKVTEEGKRMTSDGITVLPYQGSKTPMLVIDQMEDKEFLKELVIKTCKALPDKKKRR